MLYRLYVGADNKTGHLHETKTINATAKQFEGFTIFKGLGYWQGKPERVLIIEIETTQGRAVHRLARTLCQELKQEAIGLFSAKTGQMQFISI